MMTTSFQVLDIEFYFVSVFVVGFPLLAFGALLAPFPLRPRLPPFCAFPLEPKPPALPLPPATVCSGVEAKMTGV